MTEAKPIPIEGRRRAPPWSRRRGEGGGCKPKRKPAARKKPAKPKDEIWTPDKGAEGAGDKKLWTPDS